MLGRVGQLAARVVGSRDKWETRGKGTPCPSWQPRLWLEATAQSSVILNITNIEQVDQHELWTFVSLIAKDQQLPASGNCVKTLDSCIIINKLLQKEFHTIRCSLYILAPFLASLGCNLTSNYILSVYYFCNSRIKLKTYWGKKLKSATVVLYSCFVLTTVWLLRPELCREPAWSGSFGSNWTEWVASTHGAVEYDLPALELWGLQFHKYKWQIINKSLSGSP